MVNVMFSVLYHNLKKKKKTALSGLLSNLKNKTPWGSKAKRGGRLDIKARPRLWEVPWAPGCTGSWSAAQPAGDGVRPRGPQAPRYL